MKKMKVFYLVVVLALLSVSIVMFSCKPRANVVPVVPDGFAGVPWGATKDQIINIMGKQGYRQLPRSGVSVVQFSGEFAGVPCEILSFHLIADSFYYGYAYSGHTKTPQESFNRIVDMLSEKYGPPQNRKSESAKDSKGKDVSYESAFWCFVDNKSSDAYDIYVVVNSSNATNKIQYYITVDYRAPSLEERLGMYRIGAHGVPTNVNAQDSERQHAAASPSPPQAAAADWKQYFKEPYATFYYDANSIQRSGDVVQVTTLHKFTWLEAGIDSKSLLMKFDHSIELLEINCRSKTTTSKRNTTYKPDGSVIRDDRFTESDKDGKPKPINPVFGEDLLCHIVCGM
jgi:hypothetical protein